jgi:hypothetical protein
MIDKTSGRAIYAVMPFGGFLGMAMPPQSCQAEDGTASTG